MCIVGGEAVPPPLRHINVPAVPVKTLLVLLAPGQSDVLSRAQMLGVMPLSPAMVPIREPRINVLCG